MKHLQRITCPPRRAMSVVEFDGMLAIFGRTLTQLNSAIGFLLTLLGLPSDITGAKEGAE
jgi:hypothetical protein